MATRDHRAGSWAGMLATLLLAAPCVPVFVHLPVNPRTTVSALPRNTVVRAQPTTRVTNSDATIQPTPPGPPKPGIALGASFNRLRLRLHTLNAQPDARRVHAIESNLDVVKGAVTSERGDLHTITQRLAMSARELSRTRIAFHRLTNAPLRAMTCNAKGIRTSLHAVREIAAAPATRTGRSRNTRCVRRADRRWQLTSRSLSFGLPRAPPRP